MQQFYLELQRHTESDPTSVEALLGQIMLATADFDIFMQARGSSRSLTHALPLSLSRRARAEREDPGAARAQMMKETALKQQKERAMHK